MSNLKKLLVLETRLEELVRSTGSQNIGIVIHPQTKEETLQEMIRNGLAGLSVNIKDIDRWTVIGVSPPPRDSGGNIMLG